MDSLQPEAATEKAHTEPDAERGLGQWLVDNVAKPFVGGTGALQIYNNFSQTPAQWAAPESQNKLEWGVQALASAGGALATYVPFGKATGGAMKLLGHGADRLLIAGGVAEGLPLGAAKLLANNSAAQIFGAGIYESLKKPNEGETRLANSIGTMAGFAVFEGGNRGLHLTGAAANPLLLGAARYAVGALGGATSYETSNAVNAWYTGTENKASWEGLKDSMAQGGFVNVALPVVQRGVTRAVDDTVNSQSWGRGVPIARELGYRGASDPELFRLAELNPLARVKLAGDGVTRADIKANTIFLPENSSPGRIAHELAHLRLAREVEPQYREIAQLVQSGDKANAQERYYQLRSYVESQARSSEDRVNSRTAATPAAHALDATTAIVDQRTSDGRTYGEVWRDEWTRFEKNTNYRPRTEFDVTDGSDGTDYQMFVNHAGSPEKLGANIKGEGDQKGTNFAVYAPDATNLDLWLFNHPDDTKPSQVVPMLRTGDVWHRFVPQAGEGTFYLFNADGPYDPLQGKRVNRNVGLLDPYSRAITSDTKNPLGYDNSHPDDPQRNLRMGTDNNIDKLPKSVVVDPNSFDWQGDKRPQVSLDDTVILEVNVRGMTAADPTVPENLRGTYAGLALKAGWIKSLGQEGRKGPTTVQLMPTMEFDFDDFGRINPLTGERLLNSWGYNTVGFMAPDGNYAASGRHGQQVNEFKQMVKAFHDQGIEVILDIVLNHTREGNEHGPTLHFKGLANDRMYLLEQADKSKYQNHTGTGNTVNTNHPKHRFVLDTLRFWAEEMHVDGFRFDLASTFKFDSDGQHKWKTPIIDAIENDPLLSKLKLIAEPWTAGTAYDRGAFSDKIWMEQDGKFRDTVRRYAKGEDDQLPAMVEHIKGSPNEFDRSRGRRPNTFVVYHDGMLNRDLVSYNEKKNLENAEDNRDGDNDNHSWNSGYEGPVKDAPNLSPEQKQQIEDLRMMRMKNHMALLLMSQGVPTIYYLDLFGQTNDGNNNVWAQPRRNVLDWSLREQSPEYFDFLRYMVDLRRTYNVGGFGPGMPFHGSEPYKPMISKGNHFVGFSLPDRPNGQTLHVYSNMYWGGGVEALLTNKSWLLADTSQRFSAPPGEQTQSPKEFDRYVVGPRSMAIFVTPKPQ